METITALVAAPPNSFRIPYQHRKELSLNENYPRLWDKFGRKANNSAHFKLGNVRM
jgi:hypothetical protein